MCNEKRMNTKSELIVAKRGRSVRLSKISNQMYNIGVNLSTMKINIEKIINKILLLLLFS